MKQASKPIRIVIDTNLFISLLIGKRSVELREILVSPLFTIVVSQSLIEEIRKVANRPKFSRCFNLNEVEAFLEFLRGISDAVELKEIPARCRDPKDDYLLELAMASKAEFLLTGDDDLLEMKRVGFCRILTVRDFLLLLQSQK
jgi:putative PIN family toxin of toxin-antitoxin system